MRHNFVPLLRMDLRRMFHSRLFYILVACALLIPILMTVMMTMMDGSETVNRQTGEITIVHGPENAWQAIGSLPTQGSNPTGGMDVLSMCNINMMFMVSAVFVGLFVSGEFRSGFSKNIFSVHASKKGYVLSKTFSGWLCCTFLLLTYFLGAMAGGALSGLSFELPGIQAENVLMCILSKIALSGVFVPVFLLVSISAKKMSWLSICGGLGAGMLLFLLVPQLTPLNATAVNLLLCLAGGILFSFGLGFFSCRILNHTSLA